MTTNRLPSGRTTRLLTIDSHERAVMIGVTVAVLVLVIAGKAGNYRPATLPNAVSAGPGYILLATAVPTPSLPTPHPGIHPTDAPVVIVAPPTAVRMFPDSGNIPTAVAEPTATPLPPTAVPPTEAPAAAPVEQAPAQQWVPETAPVYSPNAAIDQTEQKIQELPQEVAHPWAGPPLPPPKSAGNGAQS